jgi:hypothetical protein
VSGSAASSRSVSAVVLSIIVAKHITRPNLTLT